MSNSAPAMDDAHRFAPAAPDETLVYGACCPGWHTAAPHADAIDQWIAFLQERNVERVCCLLTGRQLDAHDANIGRYRDAFGPERVLHAPIPDHHLADIDRLRSDILPFLNDAVAREEPVVVHCLAGIGRTGHVLAAWLVHARGYDPADAVGTVREMGRDATEAVQCGNATRADLFELLDAVA